MGRSELVASWAKRQRLPYAHDPASRKTGHACGGGGHTLQGDTGSEITMGQRARKGQGRDTPLPDRGRAQCSPLLVLLLTRTHRSVLHRCTIATNLSSSATHLCLLFGVAWHGPQLLRAVRKLRASEQPQQVIGRDAVNTSRLYDTRHDQA
jgi:hypothetical protein